MDVYAVAAVVAGVRQRRIDVVYASSPHLLTGLAGYAVARLRRVAFVLEVRDLWPRILVDMGRLRSTSVTYRTLRRLELFLYRHADQIGVLAEGSADAIRSDCSDAPPITFIPNGSDAPMFRVVANRTALRNRYGMTGLTFVYAGARGPATGLDLVLDAAENVQADVPDVEFMLVGDGVEEATLMIDAGRRGLANVRFLRPSRSPRCRSCSPPPILGSTRSRTFHSSDSV